MKLLATLQLYCSAIGDSAKRIFNKKIGKTKGLSTIEDNIKLTAIQNAKGEGGELSEDELAAYVKHRMKYMRNSFKKLNNPKTDKSQRRIDLIDETETKAATWFGRTKGHASQGGERYKVWVDNDGCENCTANADEGPIPVDDTFSSGDYAPPAHPNCTCDLDYVNELED